MLAATAAADKRPVLEAAGALMRRSFAANFQAGGRPRRWEPLRPNTVASKSALGLSNGYPYATQLGRARIRRLAQYRGGTLTRSLTNILIARGDLRDSAVQLGKAGHIHRIDGTRLEEGTQHYLAEWHQDGTKPYTIRPRRARMLRFVTTHGVVKASVVHHPGLPARPFILMQKEDVDAIASMFMQEIRMS